MNIQEALYCKSINGTDKILGDTRPHVVFVGRSNVGKSSVINTLTNRKNLVRTSKKPGKTKMLDFFIINNALYFVDIPGYGFAEVHSELLEHLRKLILWYFEYVHIRKRIIVLIVDINVGFKEFDYQMMKLAQEQQIPIVCVANKFDKVKASDKNKRVQVIEEVVGKNKYIIFSAKTGEGKQQLLTAIEKTLAQI